MMTPKLFNARKTMKQNYSSSHLLSLFCTVIFSSSAIAGESLNWDIGHLDRLTIDHNGVYLDRQTISGALYDGPEQSTLSAIEHDRMLFILEGQTLAKAGTQQMTVNSGDVVFLKAQEQIEFSTPIKIMAWTSKSLKTNHNLKTKMFSKAQIEARRTSSENVWNPFIRSSTMVAGLYMLPERLGGDDTLSHEMDEINFVINGSAKFKMDDEIIDVSPGSIMWVKRGVGHYFYDLSENFDVFIFFENTSHRENNP